MTALLARLAIAAFLTGFAVGIFVAVASGAWLGFWRSGSEPARERDVVPVFV